MFDRFTTRARKVCALARAEAERLNHDYIAPEHLLLGLIKEGSGIAAVVLGKMNIDLEQTRRELETLMKPGSQKIPMRQLPFTMYAKKVLEYSIEEAHAFEHDYVGTEHLLLGLMRVEASLAAQVLSRMNLKIDEVRNRIRETLSAAPRPATVMDPPPDPQYASEKKTSRFGQQRSSTGFFDRFTDRARKIMSFARREADRFNHDYIGTEHILLGLLIEGSGVAATVLENLDVDLEKAGAEVEARIKPASPVDLKTHQLPFTPRGKKVLEFAIDEARMLDHNYVGSEHLLLGLLREHEGTGGQVLMSPSIRANLEPLTLEIARDAVREFLGK